MQRSKLRRNTAPAMTTSFMLPSTKKIVRAAAIGSGLIYLLGVVILLIMKHYLQNGGNLDISQVVCGPAITIASTWILYFLVWKVLSQNR